MEPVNCVKYRTYRGTEEVEIHLFYYTGWEDNRGLTEREANIVYPQDKYKWIMVNNNNV